MRPFVFSADSHILEPNDLFLEGLPASLKPQAIHAKKVGEYLVTGTQDKEIFKLRVGLHNERQLSAERIGHRELEPRLLDMAKDGVDAEIIFPSLGLWLYCLTDPEAEAASCQVYNDWDNRFLSGHLDRFVRCGVLPVLDFSNTLAEMKRIAALGFTAAMIPAVTPPNVPKYNDEAWDPVFALAGDLGIVLVLHTGTGQESVTGERGPGAAVINYTAQLSEACNTCMYLVAGGVLDRNPKAKVAFIESGASWLAGVAERLDEVYEAHNFFVRPKLSVMPSEVIKRQVHASFQHDRACIMSRSVTGVDALMFASDYPHAEGTFPDTGDVYGGLFKGIDISDADKAAILGGNAAKLFRFDSPVLREKTMAPA